MKNLKVNTALKAEIIVVCGGSGSGKSAWVKRQIAKEKRLAVWDIDDEYSEVKGMERVTDIGRFIDLLLTRKTGKFCFVGRPSEFEEWALAVFNWGNCAAVAEELAGVTSPGKAPDGWHALVSRGRKRGITIYGVTQRPSESDKTIIGNATHIHVCKMRRAADRACMAKEMDIDITRLNALKPLEWIELSPEGIKTGKLRFLKSVNGSRR